jgi:hypothetical protein
MFLNFKSGGTFDGMNTFRKLYNVFLLEGDQLCRNNKIQYEWTQLLILTIIMISGCDIIDGIFKTGIGVGAFIVIALVILIFVISRWVKR